MYKYTTIIKIMCLIQKFIDKIFKFLMVFFFILWIVLFIDLIIRTIIQRSIKKITMNDSFQCNNITKKLSKTINNSYIKSTYELRYKLSQIEFKKLKKLLNPDLKSNYIIDTETKKYSSKFIYFEETNKIFNTEINSLKTLKELNEKIYNYKSNDEVNLDINVIKKLNKNFYLTEVIDETNDKINIYNKKLNDIINLDINIIKKLNENFYFNESKNNSEVIGLNSILNTKLNELEDLNNIFEQKLINYNKVDKIDTIVENEILQTIYLIHKKIIKIQYLIILIYM